MPERARDKKPPTFKEDPMRAVTWQGRRKVSVDNVPDPAIKEPNDAIIRVTSTNICGSDLHLYEVLGAFMSPGDILGHEAMGVVEEVGREVDNLSVGDRIVIPFNISCGSCFMCDHGLQSQCETTQNRDQGTGAALFGYSKLYGEVAGGQAEYLRVPQAQYTHIKVPDEGPDERYVYLSDVLPTAWQAVEYADVPDGGTLVVLGLGPIGSMACRIASHRKKCTVIGVDLVTERLDRARPYCSEVIDLRHDDAEEMVKGYTAGRGADAVIDAVGMEAHGSPVAEAAQTASGFLPSPVGRVVMKHAGVDRLAAFNMAIALVRRGGTISLSGVYGGAADPVNMMTLFDKQIQLRMGQANVKKWIPDIMPLLTDDDPLGVEQFATHRLPLSAAPDAYEKFRKKQDGMVKVVLTP
jgi:threonine dehydrogenase-like Zn-dependent dehydrogenase